MRMLTAASPGQIDAPAPIMLEPRHWLAALAMLFVLFAPYQTLVQTVITDDEIRLGVEVDSYDMIWVNVAYLVGFIYGIFTGTMLSVRIGKRDTLVIGLLVFCFGNVLCGAATGLLSLAFGRFVEGFGKLMLMAVGRATLYKQFDRALLVAIGFYGVFAYSTRYWTPLINAYIDVYLSWRWTYWAYVPVSLIATVLVLCFFRPDRPPQPVRMRLDWLAITTFVAWIISIDFAFSWYRRWGGWSSNAFVGCVALCVALPVALAAWLGSGLSRDEHLKHVLGSRVYVLSLDNPWANASVHGGCTDDRRHVLHRVTGLSPSRGGLAHGADLGRDGDDDVPHNLVSLPVAASFLVDRRDDRMFGNRMVVVFDR